MKNICIPLRLLPCLLLLLSRVAADAPSPTASSPTASSPTASSPTAPSVLQPLSLAQALTAMPDASVPHGSLVLTVQPEWVMPAPPQPSDARANTPADVPPSVNFSDTLVATPDSLAARYGRSLQVFSHVIALAPPTMTVLASNPDIANLPLSQLAAQHPTPFLLGTLTQAQLRQMSTTGLAFGDLTPDQQGLLKAALPHPFQVVPKSATLPRYSQNDLNKTGAERAEIDQQIAEASKLYQDQTLTIPDDRLLSSLRLYGFLASDFSFRDPDIGVGYNENGFETTGTDKLASGGGMIMGSPGVTSLQSMLRTDMPNVPKDSDLRWNRRDLEVTVSVTDLKTVDDLVARLAKATGRELYADMRYGRRTLLARGDLTTRQPAGDLMPALAVCVCGAWRQVGSAYVLTDDVSGLGTRQNFLREMVQIWGNRLSEAGKAVGGHLRDLDWLHALQFAPGDIGALSPAQVDTIQKKYGTNYGDLPWKELPAPLQAGLIGQLMHQYDDEGMASYETIAHGVAKSLKPDTSVDVSLNLRVGVGLPDTGIMTLGEPYRVQMPEPAPPPTTAIGASPTAQANSITLDKPLRGVLCAPKTSEEARAVVAQLPKMGLNTLLLDVFTNGRTYFPNHSLPPPNAKAAGVLQAALDAAKSQHIFVYAVLDTLCWRKDGAAIHPQPWPAGFSEDLTITGEAPDRSVQRQLDAHSLRVDFDREYEMVENGNQGWASPLDPKVRTVLPDLIRDLAATSGLSGIVFQDTAPPGYLNTQNGEYQVNEEGMGLGYTLENRLAYLRGHKVDPVDISIGYDTLQLYIPTESFQISFEASIPSLQMFGGSDNTLWNSFRGDADTSLLAECYAAAHSAQPKLPLFMRERQRGLTFDPWTDPKKLNQYATLDSLSHPFQQITPRSILSIAYGPVERVHPDRLTWRLPGHGQGVEGEDGKRAGGEVFDLVTGGAPDNLLDTLDKLNVFLKKPAETKP